ncbi:unnamed protein product, partial [Rotaria sp. Silwood1]
IDLTQAERSTSVLTHHELSGCQPRTLPDKNNGRYAYLPIFPMGSVGVDNCLLLANVPEIRLTPQEMARRQHGAYTSEALRMMNTYKYIDTFSLSEQDAEELTLRLQVGQSIITFNADRLRCICGTLLTLHALFRRNDLCQGDVSLNEPTLNSKQMAMALEFYLQMDGHFSYK